MESYFFVPASKIHKIEELKKVKIKNFIIDFEDAIQASKREDFFLQLDNLKDSRNYFYRVPLHSLLEPDQLDFRLINKFIEKGYTKFVFPKISSIHQLDKIFEVINFNNLKIILLVETPKLYLELQFSMFKYAKQLYGVGLGSHDFMSIIGGKHTLKNLEILRQNILYLGKSYNIIPIDIASMQVNDEESFVNEVMDGFNKGYEAKFIIHPNQNDIMNNIQFYSEKEYNQALKIKEALSKADNKKEFSPVFIDGKIIEQPHINRAENILKKYKK